MLTETALSFLLFSCLTSAVSFVGTPWVAELVDFHDRARNFAQLVGQPLAGFVWNDALADTAEANAVACSGHSADIPFDKNENRAWRSGTNAPTDLDWTDLRARGWVETLVNQWVREDKAFVLNQLSPRCAGGFCAHYTPIVWEADVEYQIGCGAAINCGQPGQRIDLTCQYFFVNAADGSPTRQANINPNRPYELHTTVTQAGTSIITEGVWYAAWTLIYNAKVDRFINGRYIFYRMDVPALINGNDENRVSIGCVDLPAGASITIRSEPSTEGKSRQAATSWTVRHVLTEESSCYNFRLEPTGTWYVYLEWDTSSEALLDQQVYLTIDQQQCEFGECYGAAPPPGSECVGLIDGEDCTTGVCFQQQCIPTEMFRVTGVPLLDFDATHQTEFINSVAMNVGLDPSVMTIDSITPSLSERVDRNGIITGSPPEDLWRPGRGPEKLFDGRTRTFLDCKTVLTDESEYCYGDYTFPEPIFLSSIRYRPRNNRVERVRGAEFVGDSTDASQADYNVFTIPDTVTAGFNTYTLSTSDPLTAVSLQRITFRTGPAGHGNLAEIQYFGRVVSSSYLDVVLRIDLPQEDVTAAFANPSPYLTGYLGYMPRPSQ